MNWTPLTDLAQLETIVSESQTEAVVVFKHSTRCSISHMAKGRLDRGESFKQKTYYLDLIEHRDISDALANRFQVHHESPQILIIRNGECVYAESHNGIIIEELEEQLTQHTG